MPDTCGPTLHVPRRHGACLATSMTTVGYAWTKASTGSGSNSGPATPGTPAGGMSGHGAGAQRDSPTASLLKERWVTFNKEQFYEIFNETLLHEMADEGEHVEEELEDDKHKTEVTSMTSSTAPLNLVVAEQHGENVIQSKKNSSNKGVKEKNNDIVAKTDNKLDKATRSSDNKHGDNKSDNERKQKADVDDICKLEGGITRTRRLGVKACVGRAQKNPRGRPLGEGEDERSTGTGQQGEEDGRVCSELVKNRPLVCAALFGGAQSVGKGSKEAELIPPYGYSIDRNNEEPSGKDHKYILEEGVCCTEGQQVHRQTSSSSANYGEDVVSNQNASSTSDGGGVGDRSSASRSLTSTGADSDMSVSMQHWRAGESNVASSVITTTASEHIHTYNQSPSSPYKQQQSPDSDNSIIIVAPITDITPSSPAPIYPCKSPDVITASGSRTASPPSLRPHYLPASLANVEKPAASWPAVTKCAVDQQSENHEHLIVTSTATTTEVARDNKSRQFVKQSEEEIQGESGLAKEESTNMRRATLSVQHPQQQNWVSLNKSTLYSLVDQLVGSRLGSSGEEEDEEVVETSPSSQRTTTTSTVCRSQDGGTKTPSSTSPSATSLSRSQDSSSYGSNKKSSNTVSSIYGRQDNDSMVALSSAGSRNNNDNSSNKNVSVRKQDTSVHSKDSSLQQPSSRPMPPKGAGLPGVVTNSSKDNKLSSRQRYCVGGNNTNIQGVRYPVSPDTQSNAQGEKQVLKQCWVALNKNVVFDMVELAMAQDNKEHENTEDNINANKARSCDGNCSENSSDSGCSVHGATAALSTTQPEQRSSLVSADDRQGPSSTTQTTHNSVYSSNSSGGKKRECAAIATDLNSKRKRLRRSPSGVPSSLSNRTPQRPASAPVAALRGHQSAAELSSLSSDLKRAPSPHSKEYAALRHAHGVQCEELLSKARQARQMARETAAAAKAHEYPRQAHQQPRPVAATDSSNEMTGGGGQARHPPHAHHPSVAPAALPATGRRDSPKLGWVAVSKAEVHTIVDSVMSSLLQQEIGDSNESASLPPLVEPHQATPHRPWLVEGPPANSNTAAAAATTHSPSSRQSPTSPPDIDASKSSPRKEFNHPCSPPLHSASSPAPSSGSSTSSSTLSMSPPPRPKHLTSSSSPAAAAAVDHPSGVSAKTSSLKWKSNLLLRCQESPPSEDDDKEFGARRSSTQQLSSKSSTDSTTTALRSSTTSSATSSASSTVSSSQQSSSKRTKSRRTRRHRTK